MPALNRRTLARGGMVVAIAIACAAAFLVLTVPTVPTGPVVGTGQDEWYNVVRALRALYEYLNPSYFIHPALYYELLALLYGGERLVLTVTGRLAEGSTFLDYFLAHESQFLDVARYASTAFAALAVMAGVWLGWLIAGPSAALLAGALLATLPLLQTLAGSIRVDALALAVLLGATALVIRAHRSPGRRSLLVAAAGIGVAASANYPGALLLLLLGWSEWAREGGDALPSRRKRLAIACAVAAAVFVLLNPYVLFDPLTFLTWFFFQAKVPLLIHPHAKEPSLMHYVDVIVAQGPAAVAACAIAVTAVVRPRHPCAGLAAFGLAYLVAFSVMQSQYDRFALPALALLCVAGAAWLCTLLSRIARGVAVAVAVAAGSYIFWSAGTRMADIAPAPGDADYRAEMFAWIAQHVPPTATLMLESDTMPLLQTVYDPGADGRRFETTLRAAFEKRHPHMPKKIVKAQFIAAVYNYDPKQLDSGDVYFLASSRNREFIDANPAVLVEPAAFYAALDERATVVHESGGFRERLLLYATTPPQPRQ